jgi:hypothetical protein
VKCDKYAKGRKRNASVRAEEVVDATREIITTRKKHATFSTTD